MCTVAITVMRMGLRRAGAAFVSNRLSGFFLKGWRKTVKFCSSGSGLLELQSLFLGHQQLLGEGWFFGSRDRWFVLLGPWVPRTVCVSLPT